MGELTKMPNNNVTVKLIDLLMTQSNPDDKSKFGVFIVMEYLQSDLKKLMNSVPDVEITEDHILNISYNLFCALKFMHTANVLHRDLKPANILIDTNCNVKICDFGLSRTMPECCVGSGSGNSKRMRDSILKSKLNLISGEAAVKKAISTKLLSKKEDRVKKKRSLSNHVGSRWYRAPEISLVEKQYDFASDVWSIGCTIFELLKCSSVNN